MSWEEKGYTLLEPTREGKYFYKNYVKVFDDEALSALEKELKKFIGFKAGHLEVHDLEALRFEDDYTYEASSYTFVENGYCAHTQEIIFTDADFIFYKITKRDVDKDEDAYEFRERVRFIFDTLKFVVVVRRQFSSDGGLRTLKIELYGNMKEPVVKKVEKLLRKLK
uniref:T26-32p n=1 Tax=Thermococcus sp. 26/2 TaxID=758583 RepID=D6MY55_9EURY|nr:t26-32p [Thermococcus sp. 26/2]